MWEHVWLGVIGRMCMRPSRLYLPNVVWCDLFHVYAAWCDLFHVYAACVAWCDMPDVYAASMPVCVRD